MTDIVQGDVETRTRSWSITDEAGAPVAPSSIRIVVRDSSGNDVIYTTTGEPGTVGTLTSAGDGTGTWTITAGDLAVRTFQWWAIAVVGTQTIIPTSMTGSVRITDR